MGTEAGLFQSQSRVRSPRLQWRHCCPFLVTLHMRCWLHSVGVCAFYREQQVFIQGFLWSDDAAILCNVSQCEIYECANFCEMVYLMDLRIERWFSTECGPMVQVRAHCACWYVIKFELTTLKQLLNIFFDKFLLFAFTSITFVGF